MSQLLPDILLADHEQIKSHLEELSVLMSKDETFDHEILELFAKCKSWICAHSKAEELTIYELIEQNPDKGNSHMLSFIYEGYEEHDLISRLLTEMGQVEEEVTAPFRAKLKVMCNLILKHIETEEIDFLPQVRTVLSEQELLGLGTMYLRERDAILKKRSGFQRPASSIYSFSLNSH